MLKKSFIELMKIPNGKITVTISFLSTLRHIVGISKTKMSVGEESLKNLIQSVQKEYFGIKNSLFYFDQNNHMKLNDEIILLINDVDYRVNGEIDNIKLDDGDHIVFLSSIHGG